MRNPTSTLAQAERAALADSLEQVGPDAPTLCEGWNTHDLAAHLVLRETRPDMITTMLADQFPMLARHAEELTRRFRAQPYEDLIATFRSGPPAFSGFSIPGADRYGNGIEYVIHHEDVLRAQPEPLACSVDPALYASLWWQIAGTCRLFFRHSPVGVLLRTGEGPDALTTVAKPGMPRVVVTASCPDLLLMTSGRLAHANYELSGLDDTVTEFRAWLAGH